MKLMLKAAVEIKTGAAVTAATVEELAKAARAVDAVKEERKKAVAAASSSSTKLQEKPTPASGEDRLELPGSLFTGMFTSKHSWKQAVPAGAVLVPPALQHV